MLCAAGCTGPNTVDSPLQPDTKAVLVAVVRPGSEAAFDPGNVVVVAAPDDDALRIDAPDGFRTWVFELPYTPAELQVVPGNLELHECADQCGCRNLPEPTYVRDPQGQAGEAPDWYLATKLQPLDIGECASVNGVVRGGEIPSICCDVGDGSCAGEPFEVEPTEPAALIPIAEPCVTDDQCGAQAFGVPTCVPPLRARLGTDTCVDVYDDCPTDGWPREVPTGATYVDPTANAGSADGSRTDPFVSIPDALATNPEFIALRAGEYRTSIRIGRDVEVRGPCATQTRIGIPVIRDDPRPASVTVTDAATATIADVTIVGGALRTPEGTRGRALLVNRGANLLAEDVIVSTPADDEVGVDVALCARLVGRGLIAEDHGVGLRIRNGGHVDLRDSTIGTATKAVDCQGVVEPAALDGESGDWVEACRQAGPGSLVAERTWFLASTDEVAVASDECALAFRSSSLVTAEGATAINVQNATLQLADAVVRAAPVCTDDEEPALSVRRALPDSSRLLRVSLEGGHATLDIRDSDFELGDVRLADVCGEDVEAARFLRSDITIDGLLAAGRVEVLDGTFGTLARVAITSDSHGLRVSASEVVIDDLDVEAGTEALLLESEVVTAMARRVRLVGDVGVNIDSPRGAFTIETLVVEAEDAVKLEAGELAITSLIARGSDALLEDDTGVVGAAELRIDQFAVVGFERLLGQTRGGAKISLSNGSLRGLSFFGSDISNGCTGSIALDDVQLGN